MKKGAYDLGHSWVRSPETPDTFRNILIPTDGSPPSLEVARHLGRFIGPETRVTLLHCGEGANPEELRRQVDGRPWMSWETVATSAPQGIFDWLVQNECDLVAMSTHGREGLAHLWNGSQIEEVARQSKCPVLVFPSGTLD